MKSLNKVSLIGNVGSDAEVRAIKEDLKVAKLSLATTETWKAKDGEQTKKTEWHNLVLWRGLAEVAEKYVKKGDPIFIEGKITNRSWEDDNGNKKYITEIVVDNLIMLKGKSNAVEAQLESKNSDTDKTNDLPF